MVKRIPMKLTRNMMHKNRQAKYETRCTENNTKYKKTEADP